MFATEAKPLSMVIDGLPKTSQSQNYAEIFDPSTGSLVAHTQMRTAEEVDLAVQSATPAAGHHAFF
jgi:acyl-CoA reductase-like NAD-dependent aldehyde dehydrogenase